MSTLKQGGHVNMMDDFLIDQLPPQILKSSLRALLSSLSPAQGIFVSHVRTWLLSNLPEKIPADRLFHSEQAEYPQYLKSIRWLFSSKLANESLPLLTHFIDSIPAAGIQWQKDECAKTLADVNADVIQAIQALKEVLASSNPDDETNLLLHDLLRSLEEYGGYCNDKLLEYPLERAHDQVHSLVTDLSNHCTNRSVKSSHENLVNDQLAASTISRNILQPIIIHMRPEALPRVSFTKLNSGLEIPRLLTGLWQMSSSAWGAALYRDQKNAFIELMESGLVAADMADHYGDAELVWGSLRQCLQPETRDRVITITKWCIFRPLDASVTREYVLGKVQERCRRVRGRVELLQFHWHDYSDKTYLAVLAELVKISDAYPDLVSNIGLCNFDSKHMEEAALYLLKTVGKVGIVSNQVQFSLIDARPVVKMLEVCNKYGIKLLTYGSFLGGLFSEKWLGKKAPDIYSEAEAFTPSQRKYFDMIMKWGTWSDFQGLLATLKSIADKHTGQSHLPPTLTNVAIRWVLDHQEVASVIVGTRLGVSSRVHENLNVFGLELDNEDRVRLDDWALRKRVQRLYSVMGDCGSEYRAE